MRANRRVFLEPMFAIGLLLLIAPAALPDADPCVLLRSGKAGQAGACADATIAQLRRDNYNVTIGDLDGLGEPAVPTLLKALSSDQWLTRAGAADALGRMGMRLEKKAPLADALAGHAEDAEVTVRQMVIGAIARIAFKTPAAEKAIRKAESDSDPTVRGLAGWGRMQLKLGEAR